MIDLTETRREADAALVDMRSADDINQQFECAVLAVKVWEDKAIELAIMLNTQALKPWWKFW